MKREHHKAVFGVVMLTIVLAISIFTAKPLSEYQMQLSPQSVGLVVGSTPQYEPTPQGGAEIPDVVFSTVSTSTATSSFPEIDISLSPYVEIVDSCGPYFQGECVNMRSGPGTEYPILGKLRNGVVLKVGDVAEVEGKQWYSVYVDDVILHPERVISDWYVAADHVQLFYDDGDHYLPAGKPKQSQKHILVDVSDEMLYAYDGDVLFMQEPISTGLDKTPTPIGTFAVFKKTPSRYMQGPVDAVSDQYYDLPGVPWNLYFTQDGAVIHGAYWHDHFGQPWSHGCINLPPDKAKKLYQWATVGTMVQVQE